MFCVLAAGAIFYFWRKARPGKPWIGAQAGAYWPDRAKNPLILRDDTLEKSFAGQKQCTVRMPFGPPNAYQHTIGDPILLTNPSYQREYQNIKREAEIDTVDWRIDPKFNSPLNNTPGSQHIPEPMIASISKWSRE